MKCLILCGGRGVIDPESRQRVPKALQQVGGRPLVWHVMQIYATAGVREFVLALGEGGDAIRRHFLDLHFAGRDIEVHSGSGRIDYLAPGREDDWRIKFVDTGAHAGTGGRIARCRRYLEDADFYATYSDCLCDVDLAALAAHHRDRGHLVTVTGVQPTSRFGTFTATGDGHVTGYTENTRFIAHERYLNGGFMAMSPGVFEHLQVFNECNLEREVFARLAADGRVGVFAHEGYWQAVDTERDLEEVNRLFDANQRPWLPAAGGETAPILFRP